MLSRKVPACSNVVDILDNGGDVGDLVEEVELALVEVFSGARQRVRDLFHHLLQELADVRCATTQTQHTLTLVSFSPGSHPHCHF